MAGISRVCTGPSNSPDTFRYTPFLPLMRRTISLRNTWALQAFFPNCWVPRRIELVQSYPGVPQQELLLIQETYFGMRERVLCYIAHVNSRAMPQQRCKHFLWMILGCWPNRLADLFQERL